MIDPAKELRIRAERLHRQVASGRPDALARLRGLPEHRKASDADLGALAPTIKRKHCLAIVARELGFQSWEHALGVLRGEAATDYGDLLYAKGCAAFLNHWFAGLEDARAHRAAHGGYLLVYRRQFLVVERDYIATLGLDPDDQAWRAINWDWTCEGAAAERQRLYAALFPSRASLS